MPVVRRNSRGRVEGADQRAHNPHAVGAPRPNVAPATNLNNNAASSKSGAEAARPRPKVVEHTADAASLSASAEAPIQAAPGPEIEE